MSRAFFNGIELVTSDYSAPPRRSSELARWIRARRRDLKEERDLQWAHERDFRNRPHDRRPAADVDPLDLASSGWGVIFPKGMPRDVKSALSRLLELRQSQAARKNEKYYRELEYEPGESKDSFFRRYGVEAGPAHPDSLPYYLLIVGGPDIVPHRFQYQLDVQYAVGRLAFDDADGYRRYAESVVAAEDGQSHVDVLPEACFFSVRTPNDVSTEISERRLVRPLVDRLGEERSGWKVLVRTGKNATKASLHEFLGYGKTPALLLTAGHGLILSRYHPSQRERQGAIICQDWPGRGKKLLPQHYLSAADIGDDARLHGLIAFLFGCYSAGTPHADDFPPGRWAQPKEAPERPFVSGLARRLLGHPNGGALAVVGHVDRAWTSSFGPGRTVESEDGKNVERVVHVESFFKQLLDGFPVGLAMDWLNERFAEMSTRLTDVLNRHKEVMPGDAELAERAQMAGLWRANNDARNFVVLGDPAVRLAAGPKTLETPGVRELRERPGWLSLPVPSLRKRRLENWLDKLGSRDSVNSVDPAAAVRALRDREEE